MVKRKLSTGSLQSDASPIPKKARRTTSPTPPPVSARQNEDAGPSKLSQALKECSEDYLKDVEARLLEETNTKTRVRGTRIPAQHGIIERIQLCNFMTHTNYEVPLGKQLSSIVAFAGENGSGKSSILVGIIVGLGGSAKTTGRGTGIKSLIKTGTTKAQVVITLSNGGPEAYKPEIYGERIIVSRTLPSSGSSSYNIMNARGHTVSKKKAELDAICTYFAIQVVNPVAILTQDYVQKFIKSSSPARLYELFSRGTYLLQLCEEYEAIHQVNEVTGKTLKQKVEYRPYLRDQVIAAQMAVEAGIAAEAQRNKCRELEIQLQWRAVKDAEKLLEEKFVVAATTSRQCSEIDDKITATLVFESKSEDRSTERPGKHLPGTQGCLAIDSLWAKRDEDKKALGSKRTRWSDIKKDIRRINSESQHCDTQLRLLEVQIREEKEKLAVDVQTQKAEIQQAIDALEVELNILDTETQAIEEECKERATELSVVEARQKGTESQLQDARRRVGNLDIEMQRAQRHMKDPLSQFGNNIHQVQALIRTNTWHGNLPLGPLGMYVELQDCDTWASLMRQCLGHLMRSYIVSDARDIQLLKGVLQQTRNSNCNIIVSTGNLFDFSRGEPPQGYLTLLRLLKISNEHVKCVLVDHAHIESALVAPTRRDAQAALEALGEGVAYTKDEQKVTRWRDGGMKCEALWRLDRKDARQALFHPDEAAATLRKLSAQKVELCTKIEALMGDAAEVGQECDRAKALLVDIETRKKDLANQRTRISHQIDEKRAEDIFTSEGTLAGLEMEHQSLEEANATYKAQFAAAVQAENDIAAEIKEIQLRIDSVKKEAEMAQQDCDEILPSVEEKSLEVVNAKEDNNHWQAEKDKALKVHPLAEAAARDAEFSYEGLRVSAKGPEIEVTLSEKELKREIDKIELALESYTSSGGGGASVNPL